MKSISALTFGLTVFLFHLCSPCRANHKDLTPNLLMESKYKHIDPQHLIPFHALNEALNYWELNNDKFENKKFLSIINFAQSSKEKRFYIIDMISGEVWSLHTSHGRGSDPSRLGEAINFSNNPGSHATALGFYKTAETYLGHHGLSLKLDGLSATNSRARERDLVIHGANYVQESPVIQGRSWGCPAVSMDHIKEVIAKLKNGGLLYATYEASKPSQGSKKKPLL